MVFVIGKSRGMNFPVSVSGVSVEELFISVISLRCLQSFFSASFEQLGKIYFLEIFNWFFSVSFECCVTYKDKEKLKRKRKEFYEETLTNSEKIRVKV